LQLGQSKTELKNKVLSAIIDDNKLIRALVIDTEDFLYATPTPEQNALLQSPELLIRKQIMPFRNVTSVTNKAKPYITSSWTEFKKQGSILVNGKVYFYIIVPNVLEKTDYGSRYDYISDRLEEILTSKNNIGEFEYYDSGDISVDNDNLGHCLILKIVDFYGV
jgi:hypothetical protein